MNRMLLGYSPDFDLLDEAASVVASPEHEASVQDSDRSEANRAANSLFMFHRRVLSKLDLQNRKR